MRRTRWRRRSRGRTTETSGKEHRWHGFLEHLDPADAVLLDTGKPKANFGEVRLCVAMLEAAFEDLCLLPEPSLEYRQTKLWVNNNEQHPHSFRWACDGADLDFLTIRRGMWRAVWRVQHPRELRRTTRPSRKPYRARRPGWQ